jgi:hypothetical protein
MRTMAKMTFQKGDETFSSEGNFNEQCNAAEEHFGVSRREGEWNMLGLLMVWYFMDEIEDCMAD